jgi:Zn-dependent peptidase ImmA (M78 family)
MARAAQNEEKEKEKEKEEVAKHYSVSKLRIRNRPSRQGILSELERGSYSTFY